MEAFFFDRARSGTSSSAALLCALITLLYVESADLSNVSTCNCSNLFLTSTMYAVLTFLSMISFDQSRFICFFLLDLFARSDCLIFAVQSL